VRLKVNTTCNVCTQEHSNAYRSVKSSPAPEITIPFLRVRLALREAEAMAQDLAAAVAYIKRLTAAVELAKGEIRIDIANGTVPPTVTTFSQLHDYVDANGYGGAFEGDADKIDIDFWNAVQDEVDNWLQLGRPE